jgi:predicted O-methyltransferase YrrM
MTMAFKTAGKIAKRINKRTQKISFEYAHRLHRWEHKQEYAEINHYLDKFRSSGGLKNYYGAYKLWNLRQMLLRFKPQRILEFGSGSSTLVFCGYLRQHDGSLLSIDEEEKWAANTRRLVNLQPTDSIEIINAKKICRPETAPREIKYELSLQDSYDFVFVDGPSLEVDGVKWKDAVNSNVLELPKGPGVIVVDGRRATAKYLAEKYAGKYLIFLSDLFSGRPVKRNYNFFSYFVKKS